MDPSPTSHPYDAPTGCPVQHQASLYGPEFAADPHRFYDEARTHGPAAPIELAPGVDATLIVQHEAALRVLQNPALFARDSRRWAALREGEVPMDSPVLPMMVYRPNCLFTDGAEHLRLRKAVTESLARLNSSRLSRDVERIADYLIDQFSERGTADLLNEYAKLLPLLLFNQIFGCPGDIGDRLTRSMSAIFDGEDVLRANAELTECLMELVSIKRRQPGEDVTSWLIQHPAGLRDEELKDQLVMLMGAGVEPERNLIGNALLLMLSGRQPGASDRRGSGMLVEDALDDVLWNNPPIANYATHFPVRDIELNGTTLKADTPVLISFAAANSDPHLTDARQTLSKGAHLAWGAGPHVCPAKSPATLIALTAVEKILNAVPDLALAVPAAGMAWRPGPFHRALVALPVRFTPTPARRTTGGAPQPAAVSAQLSDPYRTAAPAAATPRHSAEQPKKQKGWWSSFLDVFRV
ncbi:MULTISPECIES: cytochrome P450 [Streptomyces]|jgi:cytochrome P450|uniref:Cytochrome P450 n=1 Tax=Streptomyces doudnae TaxID=3075536 RepID=A0ABD5F0A8_9ACTN|nr:MULTISPECIES: cytochrome P450 [unclassified Streptomyces]MDT0440241.1 cytochrome P450 [Streptomyces sp. DSM 41981]MYQ64184.1 cytochrome P450 [Streptomyces sp. SID4950]SCD73502.1 Cytochrome P450 [Streptomyces sp. SolWspMP-5a-2]